MTFFSNHAMVMDWEMTSRSRWSAAASLANDCASTMICGSAFHRAMARAMRLLPTIFGLSPALAKMLVGPLPPQILGHASHLELPRIGDAVHRRPLDGGQGVEIVDFRLGETTLHDVPLCGVKPFGVSHFEDYR